MNLFYKRAFLGAVVLLVPGSLQAAPLFQSIPDLAATPVVNGYCSDCTSGGFRAYDSFVLGSDALVSTITFAVSTQTSSYHFPEPLSVSFYDGSTSSLGTQIATFDFDPADFISVTNTSHNTSLVTVSLGGLSLAGGQSYSLSFFNARELAIPGYAGGSGQLIVTAPTQTFVTGRSAAFELDGSAVPEPATWAMMIVGLGAVGALARGRRRRVQGSPTAAAASHAA